MEEAEVGIKRETIDPEVSDVERAFMLEFGTFTLDDEESHGLTGDEPESADAELATTQGNFDAQGTVAQDSVEHSSVKLDFPHDEIHGSDSSEFEDLEDDSNNIGRQTNMRANRERKGL